MTLLSSSHSPLGDLPRWDLSPFYENIQDPHIAEDLDKLVQKTQSFCDAYEGAFEGDVWSGATLVQAIGDFEALQTQIEFLGTYAYLLYSTHLNQTDVLQFFQRIEEKTSEISAHLRFFLLALGRLDPVSLETAFSEFPDLQPYRTWLLDLQAFRPYQLSPDLEKFIEEKSLTSQRAWVRLYDETLAKCRFEFQGKTVAISDVLHAFGSFEESTRHEAAVALGKGLSESLPLFAFITNTLAKDKQLEDTWRRLPHPVAARNLSNQIEDEVVETLVATVKKAYPQLSHRYYALKAKLLGKSTLSYWDRNAPFSEEDDSIIPWEKAQSIVLEAYGEFSPFMADQARSFFTERWIDAPADPQKMSGAFAHPATLSTHPYILLNYQGKLRDVMTLAHEIGHGIHQRLSAPLGPLRCHPPLTIAETASVFGEMLTFRSLLSQCPSPVHRQRLIGAKIEDMLNTLVRQIAFFDFEHRVHLQRAQGELSLDAFNQLWLQTQAEALGPSVHLDPEVIGSYWAYISHFIHSPFYVYAYAFGDCLANTLYALYEEEKKTWDGGSGLPVPFVDTYLTFLSQGGSQNYASLLALFSLDPHDPSFWSRGMGVIEELINEFESLMMHVSAHP